MAVKAVQAATPKHAGSNPNQFVSEHTLKDSPQQAQPAAEVAEEEEEVVVVVVPPLRQPLAPPASR